MCWYFLSSSYTHWHQLWRTLTIQNGTKRTNEKNKIHNFTQVCWLLVFRFVQRFMYLSVCKVLVLVLLFFAYFLLLLYSRFCFQCVSCFNDVFINSTKNCFNYKKFFPILELCRLQSLRQTGEHRCSFFLISTNKILLLSLVFQTCLCEWILDDCDRNSLGIYFIQKTPFFIFRWYEWILSLKIVHNRHKQYKQFFFLLLRTTTWNLCVN